MLSAKNFRRAAFDYALTDNAYFQIIRNRLGNIIELKHLPAVYMRRGAIAGNQDPFGMPADYYVMLREVNNYSWNYIKFNSNEILHLKGYDPLQGIYGKASYLGGVQDVLLSEDSTLFRRRYYLNGAHMGYILVTTDANISDETAQVIGNKVKDGKGLGNFRSMYVNIPRSSSRDPVKVIPVGDQNINDNFSAIKESTEMQIVAMHGIPPILLNIIPTNVGGLGNPIKALQIFNELGGHALQLKFLEINEMTGKNIIKFNEPKWILKGV